MVDGQKFMRHDLSAAICRHSLVGEIKNGRYAFYDCTGYRVSGKVLD
jgi:hypothetical protein